MYLFQHFNVILFEVPPSLTKKYVSAQSLSKKNLCNMLSHALIFPSCLMLLALGNGK